MPSKQDEQIHHHKPVMLEEVITGLSIDAAGCYIDATFGRGGHSQAILEQLGPQGRLLAIDKDPMAVNIATQQFADEPRAKIVHGGFRDIAAIAHANDMHGKVAGILLDLGVSSPQLDDASRGFSFLRDGPLDMRMDTTSGESAASWLKYVAEKELADIIYEYGEERYSRRIARAIVEARGHQPIERTRQLADIVAKAHPKWPSNKHPATQTFQAIRIYMNKEFEELAEALAQSIDVLRIGGRLAAISFHSLEDRMVKRFLQAQTTGDVLPAEVPVTVESMHIRMRKIGKAMKASNDELAANPRARSAVLRIGEKLS